MSLKLHVVVVSVCVGLCGAAEVMLTPLEINGFHMLCLCVLIHQLYTVLCQKPELGAQFDLNIVPAQKSFSL